MSENVRNADIEGSGEHLLTTIARKQLRRATPRLPFLAPEAGNSSPSRRASAYYTRKKKPRGFTLQQQKHNSD